MTRVWVSSEREFRELGEIRFNVAWERIKTTSKDKEDIDHNDDIETVHKYFVDEEKAKEYASKLVNDYKTAYGCATVTRQEVGWFVQRDKVAEWQDIGESEYIDEE